MSVYRWNEVAALFISCWPRLWHLNAFKRSKRKAGSICVSSHSACEMFWIHWLVTVRVFMGQFHGPLNLIFIFECSYHRRRQVRRRFIHESVCTADESPGSMSNAVSVRSRTARYDATAPAGRFGEIARTQGQKPASLRAAERIGVLYAVKVSFTKYTPTLSMLALARRIEWQTLSRLHWLVSAEPVK